jgi:NAD(P)-dependent dehydrogenase (short-subunit alcohol dehydrogenase family)
MFAPDDDHPDLRSEARGLPRRRMLQMGAVVGLAAGCSLPGSGRAAARQGQEWAAEDIPDQMGRRVLVTGGNGYPRDDRSGLGYHDALELARKGADVTIASRDRTKGAEAVRRIQAEVPGARIRFERLDLTDLTQVKAFAARRRNSGEGLDLLINNAGVMGRRDRQVTRDGHERVFGTNVIGPYVLTSELMPALRRGQSPSVVWVSSSRIGALDLDDLQYERDYDYGQAYNRSKLAVLFLALEMDRRSQAGGWGVSSRACHPGVARTFLVPDGPGMDSVEGLRQRSAPGLFAPASRGALSTLYAATSPEAAGGRYYGPERGMEGSPREVALPDIARDPQGAARLWTTLAGIGQTSFA